MDVLRRGLKPFLMGVGIAALLILFLVGLASAIGLNSGFQGIPPNAVPF